MEKYRVKVWKNDTFKGLICEEKMMDSEEKQKECRIAEDRIMKYFHWDQQNKRYAHVLSWCEYENGDVEIYRDGHLFTREDFIACVADRPEIKFVRAWHRR